MPRMEGGCLPIIEIGEMLVGGSLCSQAQLDKFRACAHDGRDFQQSDTSDLAPEKGYQVKTDTAVRIVQGSDGAGMNEDAEGYPSPEGQQTWWF